MPLSTLPCACGGRHHLGNVASPPSIALPPSECGEHDPEEYREGQRGAVVIAVPLRMDELAELLARDLPVAEQDPTGERSCASRTTRQDAPLTIHWLQVQVRMLRKASYRATLFATAQAASKTQGRESKNRRNAMPPPSPVHATELMPKYCSGASMPEGGPNTSDVEVPSPRWLHNQYFPS